jgi:integrase
MRNQKFSIPIVVKAKDGWYVFFRFNGVPKKYKFQLNRIKNIEEREREFSMLRDALHQKLKNGWDPISDNENLFHTEKFTLTEALDFALEKKRPNISKKSYAGYKGSVKFYSEAAKSLGLAHIIISEVKRSHIRNIADRAKQLRSWSNKAYNKHLNHIKAVMSELIQFDIIDLNPAHNIKNLPTEESMANIPATPEDHLLIKQELLSKDPNFYNFIQTLFHTGIRPNEILQIRISKVDIKNKQIILPPQTTKKNKERVVPINNHLLESLKKMNLGKFPGEYYLFGSFRESGVGNRGNHKDFLPGPTRIKTDTATKRWKKLVKDGLGISANMYSEKHAGANAKILAGIDLDALRELYGHSSKLMTMRYAKVIKEVYRNEIIEKSPEF